VGTIGLEFSFDSDWPVTDMSLIGGIESLHKNTSRMSSLRRRPLLYRE
jgi:hypothetical protein